MSVKSLPSRPRILGSNAGKYIGKQVTVVGEVINITVPANSITLKLPDDESMIVLMSKAPTAVEKYLITEVSGLLVSRGQIEASHVQQFDSKQTSLFNKSLYVEAAQVYDAYRNYYDI